MSQEPWGADGWSAHRCATCLRKTRGQLRANRYRRVDLPKMSDEGICGGADELEDLLAVRHSVPVPTLLVFQARRLCPSTSRCYLVLHVVRL
jgi:hypothetical protein